MQKVDELDFDSREFYERAKLKLSFSLILGAFAMLFLGMTSQFGGESLSARYVKSSETSSK